MRQTNMVRNAFCILLVFMSFGSRAQAPAADSLGQDTIGSAYVECYLVPNQWHGYCLPVENSATAPFTTLSIAMEYYEEPLHVWRRVANPAGDSVLSDRMRGYRLFSDSQLNPNSTPGVTGNLNTGLLIATVTSTPAASAPDGMNFIGNPYPSAINWYMAGLVDVDPTLYVFYPAWNNYIFWNRVTNVHSDPCRFIIPAMQGFFVRCSSGPPGTGQVILNNACRLHDNGQIYKTNPDYDNFLTIDVYSSGYRDQAFLWLSDSASFGFDSQLDAVKIPGEEGAPQLFMTTEEGTLSSMNTRPWNWPFPKEELSFRSKIAGTDTMIFSGLETFSDTLTIWLEDKQEDYFQVLAEDPVYIFTSSPEDDPDRFRIWFYNPWTGVVQQQPETYRIWSFEDKIYVDLTRSENSRQIISLYDLTGRVVFTAPVTGGMLNILYPGLTTGCYAARLSGSNQTGTCKVILR